MIYKNLIVKKNPPLHAEKILQNVSEPFHINCIKNEKKLKILSEYKERLENFITKTQEEIKLGDQNPKNFIDEFYFNFDKIPNKEEIMGIFEIIKIKYNNFNHIF